MEIDSLEIRKVDKDTELAEKLLDFVENFSWEEVKEHTVMMIKNWRFTDWETMFAAIADGTIVGMAKEGPGNLTTNVSKYEESENQVHRGQNDTGGSTTV